MSNTIISSENIESAKAAVATYVSTCEALYGRLETTLTTLTAPGANFNGEASLGYLDFHQQIKVALTTNLFAPETSISHKLVHLLDSIGDAFLVQVDPALGRANRQAGSPEEL
jgi:hypothetical protein